MWRSLRQSPMRWLFGVAFAMCGVFIGYSIYVEFVGLQHIHFLHYDYAFFYYAFQTVWHHTHITQLYDMSRQKLALSYRHFPITPYNQYVYPPQFAVFWAWLGLLPFNISANVWFVISLLLYVVGLYLLWKTVSIRMGIQGSMIAVLFLTTLMPFVIDLSVGNVNSILFACIAITYYLLYHRKSAWAGVPLGLAIVFKVTPIAILAYLIMRKKWKASLMAMITVGLLSLITELFVGVGAIRYYLLHFVSFGTTSMKNGPAPYNESLLGIMGLLQKHHILTWSNLQQHDIFYGFIAVMLMIVFYVVLRTKENIALDIGLSSLALLLFSPLVEGMHLLFLVPALLAMMSDLTVRRSSGLLWFLLFVILAFLSMPATLVINVLTNHLPDGFLLQTYMFWILLGTLMIVLQRLIKKQPRIRRG